MIKLLMDLIRIQSDTVERANQALRYCETWLTERAVDTEVIHNNGYSMLVAEIGQGKECVIWNGHVDVVPGNEEQFTPKIVGDQLFGRGAADMKAGVAAMMCAFVELSKVANQLTRRIQLHIVTDEETGGDHTSGWLVQNGFTGDFVICGEPTQLQIGLQAKGIMQFDLVFSGKASHGSRPWEGVNAIELAFHFHEKLLQSSFMQAKNEFYDCPSLNLAKIQGGTRYNVVPDECVMSYDLRYVPGQSVEEIQYEIQELIAKQPYHMKWITQSTAPAVTTESDHFMIAPLQEITAAIVGQPCLLFGQHGSADTRFYAEKGAGAIEFGPVGRDWHGANEAVSISSVTQYKEILIKHALF